MIVVTGGAGFIGSNIVQRLNDGGIDEILVVDHFGAEDHPNLKSLKFHEFISHDVFYRELQKLQEIYDFEAIIHMGASTATTETNWELLYRNNFLLTRTLAEFSLESQIRFIYASSAATYGLGEGGYSDDPLRLPQLKPLNLYAKSKHLFDLWALDQGWLKSIVGLKFFNVYGPREYHKKDMSSVVLKAFIQIQSKGKVKLFKSYRANYKHGEQCRDFVYVKDCAELVWRLINNPLLNGLYNCGTGHARTWNDLVGVVFERLNKPRRIEYIDVPENVRGHYQYFTEADMTRLESQLAKEGSFIQWTSIEDGVRSYVDKALLRDFGSLPFDALRP